jgi:protein TonB
MFDTLLASHTIGAPWNRAGIAALLLHVLLIAAAVSSTAAPHGATRTIARDTIRLELPEVSTSAPKRAESSGSHAEPGIPERPRLLDIPIDAPKFQPPRLSYSATGVPDANRPTQSGKAGESTISGGPSLSIFSTIEVDELPELLEELHPRYPPELRRVGVNGLVELQYVVGSDGRADERSVRVLISSHPAFLLAALQALRDTRFKPARRNGRPVAVLVQQTIRFRSQ